MRLPLPFLPSVLLIASLFLGTGIAQAPPPSAQSTPPQASTLAQQPGAQLISLDEAIQMALQHNHNLLAARTTIQQNQAEEITANLRPDPVLLGRLRSSCPSSSPAISAPTTSTTRRSSIWASAICSSAAKSGSIACRQPRM